MSNSPEEEIAEYLRTGRHDDYLYSAWPGDDLFTRGKQAHAAVNRAWDKMPTPASA